MQEKDQNFPMGTKEFIQNYYAEGMYKFASDFGNFAMILTDFAESTLKQPKERVPYLKTFIGVLELIANGNDDKYPVDLRNKFKKLLKNHQAPIANFKQLTTYDSTELEKLFPLGEDFMKIYRQLLADRQKQEIIEEMLRRKKG